MPMIALTKLVKWIAVKWYRFQFHVCRDRFSNLKIHSENFQSHARLFAPHAVCECIQPAGMQRCARKMETQMIYGTRIAQISCHTVIAFHSHRNLRLFITWKKKQICESTLMCLCIYSNFRATISRVPYFHHNYHISLSLCLHLSVFIAVFLLCGFMLAEHVFVRLCVWLVHALFSYYYESVFTDWYGLMLTIQILL